METPRVDAAPVCRAGDPAAPPEIEVVYRGADGVLSLVTPMAQLPLTAAPQGGKILLIGAQARNVDSCVINLTSALRDTDTGAVLTLDRRPIMLGAGAGDWLTPQRPQALSNYSNLPACPLAMLSHPVNDHVYQLEVTVVDGDQRTVQATMPVIPVCTSGGADCTCMCRNDYRLGATCSDAGGADADTGESGGDASTD